MAHPHDDPNPIVSTRRDALRRLAACGMLPLAGTSLTAAAASGVGWPWVGTSTVAIEPTLADFATVIDTGTVTYRFRQAATSTTVDPISGQQSDTSASAVLVPYLMSRTLVTNAHWRAFCNAAGSSRYPSTARTAGQYWAGGAYPAGKESHPVFFVSYTAALAFCAWLEARIPSHRFYVPTEGEWEYAALGTDTSRVYPWGSDAGIRFDAASGTLVTPFNANPVCSHFMLLRSGATMLSYYADSTVTTLADGSTPLVSDTAPLARVLALGARGNVTGWQYDSSRNRTWADFANSDQFRELVDVYGGFSTEVGSFPAGASWCGCLDMAGNAYEWTSTRNVATAGAEKGSLAQCVKGGSWYSHASSGRSTGRGEGRAAAGAFHSVGLRIAARVR